MFKRKAFVVLDEIRKQVGSNMIGLNLSSSLTNLISPVQAASKTNKLAVLKGTADTIKNMFVKGNIINIFRGDYTNSACLDIESKIRFVINIIQYCTQIFLLLVFSNYYFYIIVVPIFTILLNIIRSYVVNRCYSDFLIGGEIEETQKNIVMSKVKALIIYKIGGVILRYADQIVISAFLGLALLGQYSNYYYVISTLIGLLGIYYNSIRPVIGNSFIKDDVKTTEKLFVKLQGIQNWIVSWWSICFVCLIQDFILLWAGKDYLFDLLALLLIMLPGYVCYYFMVEEASFLVVIFGIIVIVLLTFLSNSIAILLNLIISKITRRLRNAEIIQTLISVFITLCFIIFYFIFNMSLMNAPDLVENLYKFYPLKLVVSSLAFSDVMSLLILCAICIVPFIIAVFFEVLDFNHPVNKVNNSKKELTYNKRSVMFHLFKNESKRYFKSTIYVLNTIIGAFFILLSSALMTGFGKERIESIITMYLPNVDNLLAHINAIIVMIVSVTSSTVITTSASISIEGKHFWILKAHPIDVKDIFKAKMLLNILLGGIPSVIGAILLVFVVGISYLPFAVILMLSSVSQISSAE